VNQRQFAHLAILIRQGHDHIPLPISANHLFSLPTIPVAFLKIAVHMGVIVPLSLRKRKQQAHEAMLFHAACETLVTGKKTGRGCESWNSNGTHGGVWVETPQTIHQVTVAASPSFPGR
jgi:hypothetical protein